MMRCRCSGFISIFRFSVCKLASNGPTSPQTLEARGGIEPPAGASAGSLAYDWATAPNLSLPAELRQKVCGSEQENRTHNNAVCSRGSNHESKHLRLGGPQAKNSDSG